MDEQLIQALTDLDEEAVLRRVRNRLAANDDPQAILAACREGLARVGQRFERGEYFVSELIMAGEVFKQVIAELGPLSTTGQGATRGAIVFGTVKSDIHDIGKDLVIGMLRAAGFDVTDLGIDVPPERFVAAVRETGAKVVGLSGLLTVAFDSMKATVGALDAAGLRPGVKVMIGGGLVNEAVRAHASADAFGTDPQQAVDLANRWYAEAEGQS